MLDLVDDDQIGSRQDGSREQPGWCGVEAEQAGGLPGGCRHGFVGDLQLAEHRSESPGVDVVRTQAAVGAGSDCDLVLPVPIDHDQGDAGGLVVDGDQSGEIDAVPAEELEGLVGEGVRSDRGDQGDVGPLSSGCQCLVGSLPARVPAECGVGDGLAGRGESWTGCHQIQIHAAHHTDRRRT